MDANTAAAVTASATHYANDPITLALIWVGALVILMLAIANPVRQALRSWFKEESADKTAGAKDAAERALYEHLSSQVKQYRDISDKAFAERNALVDRVARLEVKTQAYEDLQKANIMLREKLDHADARLAERDEEFRSLIVETSKERQQFLTILRAKDKELSDCRGLIASLEERQRCFEARLTSDEITLGVACPKP